MTHPFWKDRRVLITGHTGFKGAWLSLWLARAGARVVGFAKPPPTQPSLFEVARVAEGMTSVEGDVRDLAALVSTMTRHKPEIVIHMAAQSLVRPSYDDPLETYAVNVMGTATVLEAVRKAGDVRAVVSVTSDKCYENREWEWGYREVEPMGGSDPYSSSKGCAELVTAAYRRSFFAPEQYARHGVAVASVRAGNVFGGGDWARDRLVPDVMRALADGRPAMIRNPRSVRPWQHLLDPLRGYLLLAERLHVDGARWGEAWNFGPGYEDARPVSYLADKLCALWGDGARWTHDGAPQPHEAHTLRVDSAKARTRLDWDSKLDLARGLEWTTAWHRAHQAGRDMRAFTMDQLEAFDRQVER